jgi:hypothetical protein
MPDRRSKRAGFLTVPLCFSLLLVASSTFAQSPHGELQYYISPYRYAFQIDPLGALLGRISGRFEFRVDPLISRYVEFAYQRNLNTKVGNDIRTPSSSLAFGERIYLRDNAAMVGLFAGVNLGFALIDSRSFSARLSLEIGYKLPLGSGSHFFLEPEMIIDAYFLKRPNMRQIFPYVALPFGYMW